MRDQLIGYVEGTLSPEERIRVMKHLADSPHWQQELATVEYVQQQLQLEMPLLGRPQAGQLDALLPDIFERTARSNRSRWQPPSGGIQTLFLIGVIFAVLMIVPFILHDPSANAAANFTQEVPLATNTAVSVYKQDTFEARYTTTDGEVATQEPAVQLNMDVNVGNADSQRNWMSASPVPAPGGTAIPSLEPRP